MIHPACKLCKGACCEGMRFPIAMLTDDQLWLSFHGLPDGNNHFYFPCRCRHLQPDGVCGIYASRPKVCRVFEVGSPACVRCVERNRPNEAKTILGLV